MNLDKLKELASKAVEVVRAKQPSNPASWYPLIAIKNALYKITDSPDLDVADADAAFIAAANPSTVLALIEVAERARALLGDQTWEHMTDAEREFYSAWRRLEESK